MVEFPKSVNTVNLWCFQTLLLSEPWKRKGMSWKQYFCNSIWCHKWCKKYTLHMRAAMIKLLEFVWQKKKIKISSSLVPPVIIQMASSNFIVKVLNLLSFPLSHISLSLNSQTGRQNLDLNTSSYTHATRQWVRVCVFVYLVFITLHS